MKTLRFFTALLVLAGPSLFAQDSVAKAAVKPGAPTASASEYLQLAEEFFASLQKSEVGQAFDGLTKNSELAQKTDELEGLKTKTRQGMDLVGGVTSYEVIKIDPAGSRLVRVTCLAYGTKFPLRWLLYFYEVDKVWRLIDLRVDDSLVRMFGAQEETP